MIRSVRDAVRELKQMDDVISHVNDSKVIEDDGRMVYKISLGDVGVIRSIFDAYTSIILDMEMKREGTE